MKVVSLFAGIGGFDLALTRLGHVIVYVNEWDKYAANTYEKNFGIRPDTRSIATIPTTDIPGHDLLVGGFPCQAFSVAGKRRGFEDTRGTLFFEIARILKDKRPTYLLLENVKGLLSHDNGRTFETIMRALDELGYDTQWQVLNSKNYGVPQNRERIFIVGNLRGKPRPQIFPVRESNTDVTESGGQQSSRLVSNAVDSSYYKGADGKRQLVAITDSGLHRKNQTRTDIMPPLRANTGAGHNNKIATQRIPLKFLSRNQRNIKGDYSFTLDSANTGGVKVGTSIRRLTPIECERLQGFPDNWTSLGIKPCDKSCIKDLNGGFDLRKCGGHEYKMSDTQRYKQLGNAVTVNVVYYIASHFPV